MRNSQHRGNFVLSVGRVAVKGRRCFVDLYVNICVSLNDSLYSLCLYLFLLFENVSMSAGNAYDCVLCQTEERGGTEGYKCAFVLHLCA
jgi:hypothetical protein